MVEAVRRVVERAVIQNLIITVTTPQDVMQCNG